MAVIVQPLSRTNASLSTLCDALLSTIDLLKQLNVIVGDLEQRIIALEHAPKAVSQLVATEYAVPRPEAKVLDCVGIAGGKVTPASYGPEACGSTYASREGSEV